MRDPSALHNNEKAMKMKSIAQVASAMKACVALAFLALMTGTVQAQTTYTWTNTTSGTLDWTTAGNWASSLQYVSDQANELIFFSNSTTYFPGLGGTQNITVNVPSTLAMNTLTLNGRGNSSGASAVTVNIASSASTWTIGDGSTATVNLNANYGASAAADFRPTVAANLTLNQATTLFTGDGTAGLNNAGTSGTGSGFLFSGSIGQAASGYGITKSGTSRLTFSSSLGFTGPLTVDGGYLILTGNINPPSGSMTVNTGAILRIGNNTATQIGTSGNYAGNISTGTGGTLQLWSTAAQEFSGIISGAGGIHKAYGGTLTLSGANTYTGKSQFVPQTTAGFTVKVSSFNSVVGGTASSSLGAPTTVANGTIDLGSGSAQATVNLTYEANAGGAATGEMTDRVINLQYNGTSDRTITANNASGVLRFTSAFTSNGGTQSGKLILAGTGAGQIDQGLPQLAALGLDKQGNGTWTLGGSGLFTGPTKITAGTLSLSSATALQNSPFDTANSVAGGASAGLKIATTTLTLGGLTGSNAFDSRFTTVSGGYSGLTALTLNTAANATLAYSGGIAEGATGMTLTKTGAGTQYLSGTMGYTGATTVNAGVLGSTSTFSGSVTVATGAGLAPGDSAGAVGTMTINNATASALTLNGCALYFDVLNNGSSRDQISVAGNLVLNGVNYLYLTATNGIAAGTYTLMTHAATTGSGSIVFPNGSTTMGNLTVSVNSGDVTLTVGAGGYKGVVWKGTVNGQWDTSTANWAIDGVTGTYTDGDSVTIDDTATATTITNAVSVSPSSVTVNNRSKNFTINAAIGGSAPLVKLGTGTLTLGSTNSSYSGGIFLGGGRVTVTSDANMGAVSGSLTFNGGELYVNNDWSSARPVTLNAVDGNQILFQGNGDWINSGAVTGDGGITCRQNPNGGTSLTLTSTSNTFKGPLGIQSNNGGMLVKIRSLADSVSANGNIIFGLSSGSGNPMTLEWDSAAGAVLTLANRRIEFAGNGTAWGNIKNSSTNAIIISTDTVNTGTGVKTLTLDAVQANPTNVFSGNISDGAGTLAVTKSGAGTWILSGTNTYTGTTTVNASGSTSKLIFSNAWSVASGILDVKLNAKVQLDYTGTRPVAEFWTNNVKAASGIYNNANAPAYILGTGSIMVGVETFTVTYNGNGNTGGSVPVDPNAYTNNATVTVLGNDGMLTKDGSSFGGWSIPAGATYAPGSTFQISTNTTLYAVWGPAGTIIMVR